MALVIYAHEQRSQAHEPGPDERRGDDGENEGYAAVHAFILSHGCGAVQRGARMFITKWEYYAIKGEYGPEEQQKAAEMRARRRGMFILISVGFSVIMVLFCVVFAAMLMAKM